MSVDTRGKGVVKVHYRYPPQQFHGPSWALGVVSGLVLAALLILVLVLLRLV